jgi:hypothetical protein
VSDDRLFPHAAPGSQRGATRAGALAAAAATLAASAFAVHSATSAGRPPQAPRCGPALEKSADWSSVPDDRDGCWEQRSDGQYFRTTWARRYYYHGEPPASSKYHGSGSVGG